MHFRFFHHFLVAGVFVVGNFTKNKKNTASQPKQLIGANHREIFIRNTPRERAEN